MTNNLFFEIFSDYMLNNQQNKTNPTWSQIVHLIKRVTVFKKMLSSFSFDNFHGLTRGNSM